jgi:WD40 repeat protein/serine/threonine protein kinase
MLDLVGQVIKSYEIKELLGTGGFGAVYRAYQPVVNREVAIKIILPEHANRSNFIRRFEAEAQIVARLEHPYIVPLYDYWRDPSGAYLVMRYLRGGNLRSLLNYNTLSFTQTNRMATQLCSALSFSHRQGVVHRDVKPDNVFMDTEGNFYLGDFGIAKDFHSKDKLDSSKEIFGTPSYLSPEQIRGETVTNRSDIYSLGIVIFEALTGVKPFFDFVPATVLYKQLNQDLPSLKDFRTDLPSEVMEVLKIATTKEDIQRFGDALQLSSTLDRVYTESLLGKVQATIQINPVVAEDLTQFSNPFKGLRAFQQSDRADFFGRDHQIQRLVDRINEDTTQEAFLAVVGASGSGKSSVVKAGLIPKIRDNTLDGNYTWLIAEMVPGQRPFEELEAVLLSLASENVTGLYDQLKSEPRGFIRAVRRILPDDNSRLFLLIDQFEEIFTLTKDENERSLFLQALVEAATDIKSRIKVVITMRADFYDRPLQYPRFAELIRDNTELVLPMNADELYNAIHKPVERLGYKVEPALTSVLIAEVMQRPGTLPMLQYTLTELFDRHENKTLTLRTYQDIGGLTGALANRAQELYNQYDSVLKEATRQLFLRLVTLDDNKFARRRVLQSEVMTLGDYPLAMRQVIEDYTKYRLLTTDYDPSSRHITVELAHEMMIQQWVIFAEWLHDNREQLFLQQILSSDSETWKLNHYDPSYLVHGTRLERFERLLNLDGVVLTDTEQQFITSSLVLREQEVAEERAQLVREQALEQRDKQRLRTIALVTSVLGTLGLTLAIVSFLLYRQAESNALTAELNAQQAESLALSANSRNALLANNPILAVSLSIQAVNASDDVPAETLTTLANAIYAPGVMWQNNNSNLSNLDVGLNSDGTRAVVASLDTRLSIIDTASGQVLQRLSIPAPGTFPTQAQFTPDDKYIIATFSDGTVRIYNYETRLRWRVIGIHDGTPTALAISPDSKLIVTSGDGDRFIRIWSLETGQLVHQIHSPGVVLSLAFSPDGKILASGSADEFLNDQPPFYFDRSVRLWDVTTGELIDIIQPRLRFIRALAFSPDGTNLAVGSEDLNNFGVIQVYNFRRLDRPPRQFFVGLGSVNALEYLDSDHLVSAGEDRLVRVWNIQTEQVVQSFEGFDETIWAMDINPIQRRVLIAQGDIGDFYTYTSDQSASNLISMIELTYSSVAHTYRRHEDPVRAVDVSPNGQWIASAGGAQFAPENTQLDTSIRIWNRETLEDRTRLYGHNNTINTLYFLTDDLLISSDWDGRVIWWDANTGQSTRIISAECRINDMAVNIPERLFAVGCDNGNLRLGNLDSGAWLDPIVDHLQSINGVAISHDGQRIATASDDETLHVWNMQDLNRVESIVTGHTEDVLDVIFTKDDQYLISSSRDQTVRVWSTTDGQEIRQFVRSSATIHQLTMNGSNDYLMGVASDNTIRLWSMTGQELYRYVGHEDLPLAVAFNFDLRFAVSGDNNGDVIVWHLFTTIDELITYGQQVRLIRNLTCDERLAYNIVSSCP